MRGCMQRPTDGTDESGWAGAGIASLEEVGRSERAEVAGVHPTGKFRGDSSEPWRDGSRTTVEKTGLQVAKENPQQRHDCARGTGTFCADDRRRGGAQPADGAQ